MSKRSFSEISYIVQSDVSYNADRKMGKAKKKNSGNTQIGLAMKLDQQMLSLGHNRLATLSYSCLRILSMM